MLFVSEGEANERPSKGGCMLRFFARTLPRDLFQVCISEKSVSRSCILRGLKRIP